jgi:hypothetical protein
VTCHGRRCKSPISCYQACDGQQKPSVELEFTLPKGTHSLKVILMLFGADHDIGPGLDVAEGEESDSDEDTGRDEDDS